MSQTNVDFVQKERNLIGALEKSNYAMFDGNKDEALDFVGTALMRFPDYANVVIRQEVMGPIWRARCDAEQYKENMERIDKDRRSKHNCAIDAFNMLNRTSKALGLEPFCNVDTTDRHAVADMVGTYVNQVFNKGIGNTMYDATKDRTGEYDGKKHIEMLRTTPMPEVSGGDSDSIGYNL